MVAGFLASAVRPPPEQRAEGAQQIGAPVARVSAAEQLCSVHTSMISGAFFRGATQYRDVNASEGDPCAASLTALG